MKLCKRTPKLHITISKIFHSYWLSTFCRKCTDLENLKITYFGKFRENKNELMGILINYKIIKTVYFANNIQHQLTRELTKRKHKYVVLLT